MIDANYSRQVKTFMELGWLLCVTREFDSNQDDEVVCGRVNRVALCKDDRELLLSPDTFTEIEADLEVSHHDRLCQTYYRLRY